MGLVFVWCDEDFKGGGADQAFACRLAIEVAGFPSFDVEVHVGTSFRRDVNGLCIV